MSLYKNGCGLVYRTAAFVSPASRYSWSPPLTPTFPMLRSISQLQHSFWESSRWQPGFLDMWGPTEHVWTATRMLPVVGRFTKALAVAFTTLLPLHPRASAFPLSRPQPRCPPYPPPPFLPTHSSPQAGESPLTSGWRYSDAALSVWGVVSKRCTGNAPAAAILIELGPGKGP